MNIRPIKNDEDYRNTLSAIEHLMDAEADTPDGDRLDILVTLVERYESTHFPMKLPDPIAAVSFVMEKKGLTPKDPVPYIGERDAEGGRQAAEGREKSEKKAPAWLERELRIVPAKSKSLCSRRGKRAIFLGQNP
jgi:antitoxin component HigA of HigAB toxin-antitoxin module